MLKILDCTIRDGGYYTNWDFDKSSMKEYFRSMDKLPIEYLEIGYRGVDKTKYYGEFFYLPNSTLQKIKKYTTKKLSIMLDAKDCINIDLRQMLLGVSELVTLVRIATDPNRIELSLKLAKDLKGFGFEVALNIMYISKINDKHVFFNYLGEIEKQVDFLYLVDSYGSMYPNELTGFIKNIQANANIELGFHGHNNQDLAFANTLVAIENGVKMIDSTVLGMGRGAGNLKTELILTYLKSKHNIDVDLNILGKLTEIFQPLLDQYSWGSNLAYIVSGSYSLPQKDVMEALEINRYSLSGIVSHLNNTDQWVLPKFTYDNHIDKCIIVGGGDTVEEHFDAIQEYLSLNKQTIVLHSTSKYIALFSKINNTQMFAVAGDELLKIDKSSNIDNYILQPSPRKVNSRILNEDNFFELKSIEFINDFFDAPLTISLQIALDIKAKDIYLVGYDGYKELKSKKELYLMQENQKIIDCFIQNNVLISLLPTRYTNLNKQSIYEKMQDES